MSHRKIGNMITYGNPHSDADLHRILALQKANLPAYINAAEVQAEGFVTVDHNYAVLKAMNHPYPHVIARDGNEVVGYTLVMLRSFQNQVPELMPMFEEFNSTLYRNRPLSEINYFVMGQVCVAKGYRGRGLFQGLYAQMKRQMALEFEAIVTEIALNNPRSLRAHEKVGFKTIKEYQSADGVDWAIVLWDWG